MAESTLLDKTYSVIMKGFVEKGQASIVRCADFRAKA